MGYKLKCRWCIGLPALPTERSRYQIGVTSSRYHDDLFYSFEGQMAAENVLTPTALLGYVFFKDIPDLNSTQGLCQSPL